MNQRSGLPKCVTLQELKALSHDLALVKATVDEMIEIAEMYGVEEQETPTYAWFVMRDKLRNIDVKYFGGSKTLKFLRFCLA